MPGLSRGVQSRSARRPVQPPPSEADVDAALKTLDQLHAGITLEEFRDQRAELRQIVIDLARVGQHEAADQANRAMRVVDARLYYSRPDAPSVSLNVEAEEPVVPPRAKCADRLAAVAWGCVDAVQVWRVLVLPWSAVSQLAAALSVAVMVAVMGYWVAASVPPGLGWSSGGAEVQLVVGMGEEVLWGVPLMLVCYPLQRKPLHRIATHAFESAWRVKGGAQWTAVVSNGGTLGDALFDGAIALTASAFNSMLCRLPPLLATAAASYGWHAEPTPDSLALLSLIAWCAAAVGWVIHVVGDAAVFAYLAFGPRLERQDLLTPGRRVAQVERSWQYFLGFAAPFCALRYIFLWNCGATAAYRVVALLLWAASLPFAVVAASTTRARRWQQAHSSSAPPLLRPALAILAALAPSASGRGVT
eukprot:Hpha_TRINITY_DN16360_c2_g8::TRINITY_DN16360_c2_g8_i1::g.58303::m.58303